MLVMLKKGSLDVGHAEKGGLDAGHVVKKGLGCWSCLKSVFLDAGHAGFYF